MVRREWKAHQVGGRQNLVGCHQSRCHLGVRSEVALQILQIQVGAGDAALHLRHHGSNELVVDVFGVVGGAVVGFYHRLHPLTVRGKETVEEALVEDEELAAVGDDQVFDVVIALLHLLTQIVEHQLVEGFLPEVRRANHVGTPGTFELEEHHRLPALCTVGVDGHVGLPIGVHHVSLTDIVGAVEELHDEVLVVLLAFLDLDSVGQQL